jgi:hypothetical protein
MSRFAWEREGKYPYVKPDPGPFLTGNAHLQRPLGFEYLNLVLPDRSLFGDEGYVSYFILPLLYLQIAIASFVESQDCDCLCTRPDLKLQHFL